MKRKWGRGILLSLLLIGCLGAISTNATIVERYGPMSRVYSSCRICDRHRVITWVKWPWQRKAHDHVEETEASRWVDSIVGSHEHLWVHGTCDSRERWFGGGMSVCCAGLPISTIHHYRDVLSDEEARQWLAEFHALMRGENLPPDVNPIDDFECRLEKRVRELKPPVPSREPRPIP